MSQTALTLLNAVTANVNGDAQDAGRMVKDLTMTVAVGAGVTAYSVQLLASVDGVSWANIGFPVAAAGTLGTQIGPVSQTTYTVATWSACPFRYFKANLSALAGAAGPVTAQLALG